VVIRAHRPSPVAQVSLQQHQGPVAGLLKRLQLDPAARHPQRPRQIAAPHPRGPEQVTQIRTLMVKL
jgi:hypothetical protein